MIYRMTSVYENTQRFTAQGPSLVDFLNRGIPVQSEAGFGKYQNRSCSAEILILTLGVGTDMDTGYTPTKGCVPPSTII